MLTNGQFSFTLQSQPGLLFEILASKNLTQPGTDWTSLVTFTNATGIFSFTDPATRLNQRFYRAHQLSYPRRPLGVYAKVDLTDVIKSNPNTNWNSYFNCLYWQLLDNTAISGLTLNIRWDLVNTSPGNYNWEYVTNAFDQVSIWNTANPNAQKNIQFIVVPGFNSPRWLLTNIVTSDGSCDGLFTNQNGSAASNCGSVTFIGYNENTDGNVLPLPWDQTYKAAWTNFLCALNKEFGDNPLLVSISVAGPTGGSAEMILPDDENTCPCHTNNDCSANCYTNGNGQPVLQPNGYTPNQMWNLLLGNHYGPLYATNSNQAFVEEWENAIGLYDGIFHNLTLVVTPGDGEGFPFDLAMPSTNPLCKYHMGASCTAVASILTYFENYHSINGNGKASQVSGLRADGATLTNSDADLGGVKLLAAETAAASAWDQIIGGAQFDHAFSGCLPTNCAPNPEQDEFKVLATFFNGTLAVNGTTNFPGLFTNVLDESTVNPPLTIPAPLNYLQVYYQDVLYAERNGCTNINTGKGGPPIYVPAQDLLNQASELLFMIGETTYPRGAVPSYPPASLPPSPPDCVPP